MASTKKTVAGIVTERMIERIKSAGNWVKPWQCYSSINWSTRQEYTGVNKWLLTGGEYMTFRQGQKLGYTVQKGSPSEIIVRVVLKKYPQGKNKEKVATNLTKYLGIQGSSPEDIIQRAISKGYVQIDPDGNYYTISKRLRYYTIFSIEYFRDKDGNKPQSRFETGELEHIAIDTPESVIANYLNREAIILSHKDKNQAFYSMTNDLINIPPQESFLKKSNIVCYYSTFFHEIAHSTGHWRRLNRPFGIRGTDAYAFEELVAELTASMLCHETGLKEYNRENYDLQETNTAAYLASWVRYFENNTSAIIQAASLADKALEYVLQWTNTNVIPDTVEETVIDKEE